MTVEQEAVIVAFRRHDAVTVGGLLVCLAAEDPEADALFAAQLFTTLRHQLVARSDVRQAFAQEVRLLSDRLLPHRPRRGAPCRREIVFRCCHRPHLEVRRHTTASEGQYPRRSRLSATVG